MIRTALLATLALPAAAQTVEEAKDLYIGYIEAMGYELANPGTQSTEGAATVWRDIEFRQRMPPADVAGLPSFAAELTMGIGVEPSGQGAVIRNVQPMVMEMDMAPVLIRGEFDYPDDAMEIVRDGDVLNVRYASSGGLGLFTIGDTFADETIEVTMTYGASKGTAQLDGDFLSFDFQVAEITVDFAGLPDDGPQDITVSMGNVGFTGESVDPAALFAAPEDPLGIWRAINDGASFSYDMTAETLGARITGDGPQGFVEILGDATGILIGSALEREAVGVTMGIETGSGSIALGPMPVMSGDIAGALVEMTIPSAVLPFMDQDAGRLELVVELARAALNDAAWDMIDPRGVLTREEVSGMVVASADVLGRDGDPMPERATLETLTLSGLGVRVGGAGEMTFDTSGYAPEPQSGSMSITTTGLTSAVRALGEAGMIPPFAVAAAAAGLGTFAVEDAEGTMTFDIQAESGAITINGLPIE